MLEQLSIDGVSTRRKTRWNFTSIDWEYDRLRLLALLVSNDGVSTVERLGTSRHWLENKNDSETAV